MDKMLPKNPQIGIVIVSMNNVEILEQCLNSIISFTHCSFRIYVVAYLYNANNLKRLSVLFPNIEVVESNEIRGFSENNNLALNIIKEDYCLILNDDTFIKEDILSILLQNLKDLPNDVAVISPDIRYPNDKYQVCGRPKYTFWTFCLSLFHIHTENVIYNRYINKRGLFQTYNLSGACFLIKTRVFKEIGFFNEDYFFCPEDIEVGTILNRKGYKIFVNSDVKLYHIHGKSSNNIMQLAITPVVYQGMYLFFSQNVLCKKLFLKYLIKLTAYSKYLIYSILSNKVYDEYWCRAQAQRNTSYIIGSNQSTKAIFKRYYSELVKIHK